MNTNAIEISIICQSEKENASVGFGMEFDSENAMNEAGCVVDVFALMDSFWENYSEFEPGIEKARVLFRNNKQLTYKQALIEVFGHFFVSCHRNNEVFEPQLSFDVDIEECMYSILEENS